MKYRCLLITRRVSITVFSIHLGTLYSAVLVAIIGLSNNGVPSGNVKLEFERLLVILLHFIKFRMLILLRSLCFNSVRYLFVDGSNGEYSW
jgi:hypothetical protein